MADIDLKTATPDTTLPTTGFLFGADSQAVSAPSVYSTQTVATTLLGSTTLTGATVITSSPVIDAAQTWNASGVTFTGLRFNATDTASNAASLLLDLQTGGTSRFNLTKAGTLTFAGNLQIANNAVYIEGTAVGTVRVPGIGGYYGFTTNTASTSASTIDTFVTRRAAANLRFGAADAAAPVAQTLSVQSVVAGTTNTAGANLTITGSQSTGSGAGGSIIFQVAPAGSSGTAQNALATALTIDSTRLATFALAAAFPGGSTTALPIQLSAATYGFYRGTTQGGQAVITTCGGTDIFAVGQNNGIGVVNTGPYSWASTIGSTADLLLYRDAANTLALRNGTAAQALRVYNTFTSATEFERANIFWDSNVLKIGTEKGSAGGTARALEFQTDGTTRLTIATAGGATFSGSVQSTGFAATSSAYMYWLTRSTMSSAADGRILLANNAVTDFDRLQFGGTTSSFPALKRSTTSLQAVLANDTGFTNIQGKLTTDTAYTAGDPTTTGYLVVYDSTGTAYKIPAVAV